MPLLLRRGPTTGMRYVPTADRHFRRTERIRVDLPSRRAATGHSAEVLDRTGKTINVPVATSARIEETLTWVSAELALAPLAPGDYAVRLRVEGDGEAGEVITGFRVVP